jgi:hypothetical protein
MRRYQVSCYSSHGERLAELTIEAPNKAVAQMMALTRLHGDDGPLAHSVDKLVVLPEAESPDTHLDFGDEGGPNASGIDGNETSSLTDADCAGLDKLRAAYQHGGQKGLLGAVHELATNADQYQRLIGATFPDVVHDPIKEEMAAIGISEEELQALLRKLASLRAH